MDILAGGPLTGAAMNPARYFGTALAAGHLSEILVYFVGPTIGAVIAWAVYCLRIEGTVSAAPQARRIISAGFLFFVD